MKSPTLGMTIIGWPEEFEHRKIRPGTGLRVSSTGSFRGPFQTSPLVPPKRGDRSDFLGIAWLSMIKPRTQTGQSSGGIAVGLASGDSPSARAPLLSYCWPMVGGETSGRIPPVAARPSGSRYALVAVFLLLGVHAALVLDGARQNAPAFDEMIYAPAGYLTLAQGNQALNREHPPAMKLLLGLAWLGAGVNRGAIHANEHPFSVGQRLFYESRTPAHTLLLRARLVVLALSLVSALAVFLLARHLGGTPAGLIAMALYALDPLLVAHAGLATLDLGAATFFFLAACSLGWSLVRGWRRVLLAGVLLGVALASKFSTLPLLLGLLGVTALACQQAPPHARWLPLSKAAALFSVACLVVLLLYLPAGPHVLLDALSQQNQHAQDGHQAFAFGRYSMRGWWWYYGAAWLVKTPLPTLILTIPGLVALSAHLRREPSTLLPHVLSSLGILLMVVAGSIDTGVRNLLPLVPILCVSGGLAGAHLWIQGRRFRWLVPMLLLWLAQGTLAAHPSELSFFNQAAGGMEAGPSLLSDSNVDWGIDLTRVPAVVGRQPLRRLYLAYFGSARPAAHGIPQYQWMPAYNFAPRLALDGPDPKGREWIAISQTILTGVYPPGREAYAWLAHVPPTARAGASILLFDITDSSQAHSQLGMAALSVGAFAQAIPALERTLELAPNRADATLGLVAAHLRLGQSPTAWRLCLAAAPVVRAHPACVLAENAATHGPQTRQVASPPGATNSARTY